MLSDDELRALAGKLRKLQAGEAYEAADYLRACADAKPVAWRCEVRGDGTDPALDDLQAKERA